MLFGLSNELSNFVTWRRKICVAPVTVLYKIVGFDLCPRNVKQCFYSREKKDYAHLAVCRTSHTAKRRTSPAEHNVCVVARRVTVGANGPKTSPDVYITGQVDVNHWSDERPTASRTRSLFVLAMDEDKDAETGISDTHMNVYWKTYIRCLIYAFCVFTWWLQLIIEYVFF